MSAVDAKMLRARVVAQHNTAAGDIVSAIVGGVADAGGTPKDVLVLTESVLVGVCLALVRLGGDEAVLDVIVDQARQRLAALRLTPLAVEGSA